MSFKSASAAKVAASSCTSGKAILFSPKPFSNFAGSIPLFSAKSLISKYKLGTKKLAASIPIFIIIPQFLYEFNELKFPDKRIILRILFFILNLNNF